MVKYNDDKILQLIADKFDGEKAIILAPLIKGRKGHYKELFEQVKRQGFLRVRVDGAIREVFENIQLDRYKIHDIEVVVDKVIVDKKDFSRIKKSILTALKMGKGSMMILSEDNNTHFFSRHITCPESGISYPEPEPNVFSFNSPYGACIQCNGLGEVVEVDLNKMIPDFKKSIKKGALAPLGDVKNNWVFKQIEAILKLNDATLDTPVEELDEQTLNSVLYGTEIKLKIEVSKGLFEHSSGFEGVANFITRHFEENPSKSIKRWAEGFMNKIECPSCKGNRLKEEALLFKVDNKNISQLSRMDIQELNEWLLNIEDRLTEKQKKIAIEIVKEIKNRVSFLMDVGLDYLTLNRSAKTLSGGEAQRIRLATQIGTELVGVLYILDEPSIGLHQRDNTRLIQSLKRLRDNGNSVLVVEHDKEMMLESDFLIDIGPGAGIHGGKIVEANTPEKVLQGNSETAQYLNGKKKIEIPIERRVGNGKELKIIGANGHNLKDVNLSIPLGTFTCVTGVSGSGKSSLINGTLYPILSGHFYRSVKKPLPFKKIDGIKHIDKVIEIDQSPIGRTPRSNPATYTGVFTDIRQLFANLPEAKIRGYQPGRFSFNVKGGRCETCKGAGVETIEMNFLPDVYVPCQTCRGKRYNRETLEIRFKGKTINDVLNMTINQAIEFFGNIPAILSKIETLQSVGLGYVTLGQSSTTLSGGEAQRVKLASELSKKDTGNTLFILDEPTTGLHFEDIRMLLNVLQELVDKGNTVVVIEHNLDIIKVADHIIDLGKEGGKKGGEILCEGTPEMICENKNSFTAQYLKEELKN